MSAATDKECKGHFDTDSITADAVLNGPKNVIAQVLINWPGQAPSNHKFFWYVGQTVPDNTDYPDSIAPIGSRFTRLIVSGGAVTGALEYVKTAAATWTAQ